MPGRPWEGTPALFSSQGLPQPSLCPGSPGQPCLSAGQGQSGKPRPWAPAHGPCSGLRSWATARPLERALSARPRGGGGGGSPQPLILSPRRRTLGTCLTPPAKPRFCQMTVSQPARQTEGPPRAPDHTASSVPFKATGSRQPGLGPRQALLGNGRTIYFYPLTTGAADVTYLCCPQAATEAALCPWTRPHPHSPS